MRLRLAAALLVLTGSGALSAPALAQTTVATTDRRTSLSAGSGVLLYSAYDAKAGNYQLLQRVDGLITPVPVAPSARPFQADVGPTSSGHAYYVYTRCEAAAGSCDLYTFNPKTGNELRSKASDPKHDDLLPTYWKGRLAFVREYGTEEKPKQVVYNRPDGNTSRSERLPGLPSKRCDKGECIDPNGRFEAIELYGDRLAQTVQSDEVETFPVKGKKPEVYRSTGVELRLVDRGLRRSRRLAQSGQGEGAQDFSGIAFDRGRLYAGFTCVSCGKLAAGIYRYAYTDEKWAFAGESTNVKTYGLAVSDGTFFRERDTEIPDTITQCNAPDAGVPNCRIDQSTTPAFLSVPAPSDRPASEALGPVVIYHRPASGPVYFDTYVRLSGQVPRAANGSVLAGAKVDGFGPDLDFASGSDSTGGFTTVGKNRRCYVQSTFNLLGKAPGSLTNPRRSQQVQVSIIVKGRSTSNAQARLVPSGTYAALALQRLGCR